MLKYNFACQFNDGSVFYQNSEDKSILFEGKSAFTDILELQKEKSIINFWLFEDNTDNTFLVNLVDGHFEINGIPFFIHEQTVDVKKILSNFRLIYFRRVTQSINLTTEKEADPSIIYLLGWQANYPDGSNHKEIIYIK